MAQPRVRIGLQGKLIVLVTGIVLVVTAGVVLVDIVEQFAVLAESSERDGRLIAQSLAGAAAPYVGQPESFGFEAVVAQARRKLDLISLAITDRDGRVLAATDPRRVGTVDPAARSAFRPPLRAPSPVELVWNQRVRQHARAPILRGSDVVGFVLLEFYSRSVAAHARRMTRSALLLAGIWIAVGAILASIYVRRITRPLRALSAAVRTLGEGRYEVALPGREATDEVGALARRFGELAARLEERNRENARLVGELQDLNASLQQRVEDVTADLRHAKEFLSLVLASVGEGILTVDAGGAVTSANQGAHLILGRPAPEAAPGAEKTPLAGTPLPDFFREEEREHVRSRLAAALARRRPDEFEGTIARPGGVPVPVRVAVALLGTAAPALVVRLEDQTERRRLEEQLRRSDRLASLGTLSAGFAHEMGNILHVINGYSTVLLRDLSADAPARADAERIHNENRRGIELLDRFGVFARPQRAVVGRRDVRAVLEEALDAIAPEARQRRIEVVRALPNLPEMECDATLLRQAFFNVLLNGLQAMGAGGTLGVRAGVTEAGMIEVEVQDTGCGISAENLTRVFDPFFTTKEAEGTGLGLAIAHRIVEVHGGRIHIESEPGAGTRVRFELPPAGTEAGRADSQASEAAHGG